MQQPSPRIVTRKAASRRVIAGPVGARLAIVDGGLQQATTWTNAVTWVSLSAISKPHDASASAEPASRKQGKRRMRYGLEAGVPIVDPEQQVSVRCPTFKPGHFELRNETEGENHGVHQTHRDSQQGSGGDR
jgi:hypothetical protein